jgi:Ca2+-binding RTX toxin-like protein
VLVSTNVAATVQFDSVHLNSEFGDQTSDHDPKVISGNGNDIFVGAPAGGDSYDGGSGIDTLDFSSLTTPITLQLKDGSATFGSGTIVNIENVLGGSGNDVLTGNGQANLLRGNVGDDKLNGGNGNDVLYGGSGRDTLDGGNNDDVLVGGFGNDTLTGGGGVDRFVFDSLNDARDTIKDFKGTGSAQDFLVFDPGMFTGFNGDDGTDLVAGGFMRTVASGDYTQVQIDLNGGANAWATIAELTGTFTLDQVKTHNPCSGLSDVSRPAFGKSMGIRLRRTGFAPEADFRHGSGDRARRASGRL